MQRISLLTFTEFFCKSGLTHSTRERLIGDVLKTLKMVAAEHSLCETRNPRDIQVHGPESLFVFSEKDAAEIGEFTPKICSLDLWLLDIYDLRARLESIALRSHTALISVKWNLCCSSRKS